MHIYLNQHPADWCRLSPLPPGITSCRPSSFTGLIWHAAGCCSMCPACLVLNGSPDGLTLQEEVRPVVLHIVACLAQGLHSSVNDGRCRDNRGFADDYAEICWSCSSWRELLLKVRYFVTEAQSPEVIEIGLDHRFSTWQIMTTHSSDSSDSSDSLLLQALLKLMSWGLNTIREVCARLTALQWWDASIVKRPQVHQYSHRRGVMASDASGCSLRLSRGMPWHAMVKLHWHQVFGTPI